MDKSLAIVGDVFADADTAAAEHENTYLTPGSFNGTASHSSLIVLKSYQSPLEKRGNLMVKTVFDCLLALVLTILILSWLIPVLAILIKTDSPGPVFFLQKRNKKNGKVFMCIKFRTMDHCANHQNKRVTRLGRILRYHHIDELPQLLNVFWGDMSVIGPRPHMVSENIRYSRLITGYDYRHHVKPGMTGLAQSLGNFGSITDLAKAEERVGLDIEYITKWSFGMDLKILYRTCCLMLKSLSGNSL